MTGQLGTKMCSAESLLKSSVFYLRSNFFLIYETPILEYLMLMLTTTTAKCRHTDCCASARRGNSPQRASNSQLAGAQRKVRLRPNTLLDCLWHQHAARAHSYGNYL